MDTAHQEAATARNPSTVLQPACQIINHVPSLAQAAPHLGASLTGSCGSALQEGAGGPWGCAWGHAGQSRAAQPRGRTAFPCVCLARTFPLLKQGELLGFAYLLWHWLWERSKDVG